MLSYCDYISAAIKIALLDDQHSKLIEKVGPIQWDLAPAGYLVSTKKTIELQDRFGKKYTIVITDEDQEKA
jgi:hypothetical protein